MGGGSCYGVIRAICIHEFHGGVPMIQAWSWAVSLIAIVMGLMVVASGEIMASTGSSILRYPGQNEAPPQFRHVYLKYVKTHDIMPLLSGVCGDCHWVVSHSRQTVGVTASKKDWALYRAAIQQLDRPSPQVHISVDIIEVSNIQSQRYQSLFSQLASPITLNNVIQSTIQMMISSGNATIVSSPKVMGISGQPIQLTVGEQVPYVNSVQSNGYQTTQLKYIDSGVSLTITPYIHYESVIDIDVALQYNTISGYRSDNGVELPIIATRQSTLHLQVNDGETVVFTGLLDTSNHVSVRKVPLLGDIPILGLFFRRTIRTKKTTDLIYKITPKRI